VMLLRAGVARVSHPGGRLEEIAAVVGRLAADGRADPTRA